jgi:hypothetical protein
MFNELCSLIAPKDAEAYIIKTRSRKFTHLPFAAAALLYDSLYLLWII